MDRSVRRIVIVGGGTAGWLSACYLAARLSQPPSAVQVTLVESPDIATIGVGEGTWPTMRETLEAIGIDEAEFLTACDGSFKQGSRFEGWVTGARGDSYRHPFTPPPTDDIGGLLCAWSSMGDAIGFADAVTPQARVCALNLAPRQAAMPPYAGALNYGYHLDAGKLAALLARHAVEKLGVRHVPATVTAVRRDGDRIDAVETREHGEVAGDLFIDCSGFRAILIGEAMSVGWTDLSGELLNDRALAVQVPSEPGGAVASETIATAHDAGWLWDIALPTRRGVGCVYSSAHLSDDAAVDVLGAYIRQAAATVDLARLSPRLLRFPTGHRREFWKGNCVAIGLSAGFIEPLEASAIVLVELSLRALADNYPQSAGALPLHAARFNRLFGLRWRRIADFLKLHYALSERQSDYWRAQRDPSTLSPELGELLELWEEQPPSSYDFPLAQEIFPAASHQFVYYGMRGRRSLPVARSAPASALIDQVHERGRRLASTLPTNRHYLDRLRGGATPVRSAI